MANQALSVCHIVSTFRPSIGGVQRATENICAALVQQDCDVVIVTRLYDKSLQRVERVQGVPVYRLGFSGRSKLHALSFAAHSLWFIGVQLRRFHIIHVQNIDTPLLVGMLLKVLFRRKLIVTIHGEAPLLAMMKTSIGRLRLALMVRLVDQFTAINPENRFQLSNLGVDQEKISMIPNGIDTTRFFPPTEKEKTQIRYRLGLPTDAVIVMYLGRLVQFKRVDLLIQAWSRIPSDKAVLVVVGDGDQMQALQNLAAHLNVRIHFEGSTDDTASYLRAADIFVLPSGDHEQSNYEGLSVALLEAMATGLIPIVTDCSGNNELVNDGITGFRFPIGDIDALLDRLEVAIDTSELLTALRKSARELVCARYSLEHVARQLVQLYEKMLLRNSVFDRYTK